jgi:hypothetical protein
MLTAKTTTLLSPLTRFLRSLPYTPRYPPPSLFLQYQALHDLLSNAAYLSILIRLSPTIFHFSAAWPGSDIHTDMHESITPSAFERSKDKVKRGYKREKRGWEVEVRKKNGMVELLSEDGLGERREGRDAKRERERLYREKPRSVNQTHKPGVKIHVWPCIKRRKPGSGFDEEHTPLHEMRGEREVLMGMGKVVVFCERRDNSVHEFISLQDFIRGYEYVNVFLHEPRLAPLIWGIGAGAVAASVSLASVAALKLLRRWGVDVRVEGLDEVEFMEGVAGLLQAVGRAVGSVEGVVGRKVL